MQAYFQSAAWCPANRGSWTKFNTRSCTSPGTTSCLSFLSTPYKSPRQGWPSASLACVNACWNTAAWLTKYSNSPGPRGKVRTFLPPTLRPSYVSSWLCRGSANNQSNTEQSHPINTGQMGATPTWQEKDWPKPKEMPTLCNTHEYPHVSGIQGPFLPFSPRSSHTLYLPMLKLPVHQDTMAP